MSSDLIDALAELAKERNIDEYDVLDRLEQELAKSYQHILKLDWDARVTIDRNTGKIYVYELVGVGEEDPETGDYPDYEEHDVTPDDVSRIAAQSAKRVINEIVRDAARANIYKEYVDRKFEMITGTVLQSTPDFTIIKIADGIEAELPHFDGRRGNGVERNEKPEGEYYQHNQRVRAVIVGVRDPKAVQNGTASRGEHNRPAIIVSRTHPDLIRRLFELEVPEVYEGIVEVKAVSREPGTRSKVAVASLEQHLDPVGACVGPKGTRVRTVVSELRGERIDVVLWDKDPAKYVANALSPAKVTRVLADTENQYATVIVPDDQLSLAIGKEGQNARLAARLTGWHIDIKNESLAANLMGNLHSLMDNDVDLSDEGRCSYVDEQGNRCRNQARPGTHFCSVHQASAGVADDFDSLI